MTEVARSSQRTPVWVFVTVFWVLLAVVYAAQVALVRPGGEAAVLRQQLTWIEAQRDGDQLVIRVEDDGAGLPDGWRLGQGVGTGLPNLGSRIAGEFGPEGSLKVDEWRDGGVSVMVRLPYMRL